MELCFGMYNELANSVRIRIGGQINMGDIVVSGY